jgi:hypothetical protein
MRAMVAAHSPGLKSAQALEMKGAACSAVRHSSGNWAPEHELDEGMMVRIAAAISTPDPVPGVPALGAAVVVGVGACRQPRGEAVATAPKRRAEIC